MIQPIGLYSHNGFWYCPAYCFLREEIRLFRADRIKKAVHTDKKRRKLPYQSIMEWIELSESEVSNPVTFFGRFDKRRSTACNVRVRFGEACSKT